MTQRRSCKVWWHLWGLDGIVLIIFWCFVPPSVAVLIVWWSIAVFLMADWWLLLIYVYIWKPIQYEVFIAFLAVSRTASWVSCPHSRKPNTTTWLSLSPSLLSKVGSCNALQGGKPALLKLLLRRLVLSSSHLHVTTQSLSSLKSRWWH